MSHLPPPGGYDAARSPTPGPPPPRPGQVPSRVAARVVDWVLVVTVASFLGNGVRAALSLDHGGSATERWAADAVVPVLTLVLTLGYHLFFETTSGRTPGKALLELQVVGQAGAAVTPTQSLRRNAFHLVMLIALVPTLLGSFLAVLVPPALYAALAWSIQTDRLHQGWHDRFARQTYVMKVG
ncbi:RDD family protein [Nocardioides sp. CPCC 205120]|uniref:RDD family protein n=1 Tax=Nocardioides sp. CPCC 205120 TaxID=3406462 RepID=UPI003B50247E